MLNESSRYKNQKDYHQTRLVLNYPQLMCHLSICSSLKQCLDSKLSILPTSRRTQTYIVNGNVCTFGCYCCCLTIQKSTIVSYILFWISVIRRAICFDFHSKLSETIDCCIEKTSLIKYLAWIYGMQYISYCSSFVCAAQVMFISN